MIKSSNIGNVILKEDHWILGGGALWGVNDCSAGGADNICSYNTYTKYFHKGENCLFVVVCWHLNIIHKGPLIIFLRTKSHLNIDDEIAHARATH